VLSTADRRTSPVGVANGPTLSRRRGKSALTHRERLVTAAGLVCAERGLDGVGVTDICARAGMSRRTYYGLYRNREECLADTHREAFARLVGHVEGAVTAAGPAWEDRAAALVRAAIGALHADPVLAQLCLVTAVSGGAETLEIRSAATARLAALLGDAGPGQLVATGVIGGVWDLARHTLVESPRKDLADVVEAAVYLVLAPFVGRADARARAAACGPAIAPATRWAAPEPDEPVRERALLTELASLTVAYLREHPDAANADVARAVGVSDPAQISRHLARLQRAGVVERRRAGRANAWRLTERGREVGRWHAPRLAA
jgi:AcrR family transcriptional regulator